MVAIKHREGIPLFINERCCFFKRLSNYFNKDPAPEVFLRGGGIV